MFNWEYLESSVDEFNAAWVRSDHTRHVLIDGFLADGYCEKLRSDFHVLDYKLKGEVIKKHKHVRGKAGTGRDRLTALQNRFFAEINSPRMLDYVSRLTGISPIYGDDDLYGGGPHGIRTGGYLNVHTDFNIHPKTKKHRRLNILVYLNPEWRDAWGGHIELWNSNLTMPILRAAPIANRALIFETSEHSFHGHPWPLTTPADVIRCSMAAYYYSEWPEGLEPRTRTNYQLVRQQWAQLVSELSKLHCDSACLEETAVEALETSYQTGDIRTAIKMLTDLEVKSGVPRREWGVVFRDIADEMYRGEANVDHLLAKLSSQHSPARIQFAYKRLLALRSVVTVGEITRESADGKVVATSLKKARNEIQA